jgi:hypothetical protein
MYAPAMGMRGLVAQAYTRAAMGENFSGMMRKRG